MKKQTAAIVIFPPGMTPAMSRAYLADVLGKLPAPISEPGARLELGDVAEFNPDHGTPVVYQP